MLFILTVFYTERKRTLSLIFVIGGSKGGMVPHRISNSFIFIAVFGKNLQNNSLAHQIWELVPPQKNPGSATLFVTSYKIGIEYFQETI